MFNLLFEFKLKSWYLPYQELVRISSVGLPRQKAYNIPIFAEKEIALELK